MPENYTFAPFTIHEVNLLLKGLGKLPAEESLQIILNINNQVVQQQKPKDNDAQQI